MISIRHLTGLIKYLAGAILDPLVAVAHAMIKTNQWPTTSDLPFIVGHSILGVLLIHIVSPSSPPSNTTMTKVTTTQPDGKPPTNSA